MVFHVYNDVVRHPGLFFDTFTTRPKDMELRYYTPEMHVLKPQSVRHQVIGDDGGE